MTRLALALALLAAPAMAQPIACAPHDRLSHFLATAQGQTPQSLALERSGQLIETWADLETGHWTLVMIAPDGTACIIATGPLFQLAEATDGDPS
jgi:hypothetical protein